MARVPRLPRVPPTAARIGQLRRRITRNRRSRAGLGGDLASTGVGMLLDFISGFLDIDLSGDQKSKLGMFGRALGKGASSGNVDNTPLPTMETPQRVSKKANPTFATITSQLEDLIKTANKIGVYTKEQQESLLKQINQSKRIAKEQQLENKAPVVPELPEASDGSNLGPLDTSVNALIQKIDELSETVDGLANGGMGPGGIGGLPGMDISGGRRGRRPRPPAVVRSASSPTGFRYAAGSGMGGRFAPAPTPSWLNRATAAISSGARGGATRVAAPIAAGAASSRVAGLMTAGFRTARRGGGSVKDAVRRVAGPILGKALGRTALKSIPIVGAGIGAAFAASRLLQGDVVGAGVELASGVAGPLTAVPALTASVARDTYASVYGVQPEQDPNFKDRYKELKSAIDEMAKEQLSGAVKPMSTPTDREMGETETPRMRPQAAPVSQPPPIPAASPPAGASGAPAAQPAAAATTSGGGGAPAGDAAAAAPATTGGGAAQPVPSEPTTGIDLAAPTMVDARATSGETLTAQQIPVDSAYQNFGFSPTAGRFMPQTGRTNRGAAQGVGNIPSPIYNPIGLEAFMDTLLFRG